MFKQHIDNIDNNDCFSVKESEIRMVHCEKTGTIYYTDGVKTAFSRNDLLKSWSKNKNSVYESKIYNK